MIHIFIGTKAQYIKTAPVIKRLDGLGIDYNLIDSGQHAHILSSLRKELEVREPDVCLRQGADISSYFGGIAWLAKWLLRLVFTPRKIGKDIFRNHKGVCLVHGDTGTTLLSALMARRAGLDIAHIESGLRSYNCLSPFPEEIIRIIMAKKADILFPPSHAASENLKKMRIKGRIVNTGANTGMESALRVCRNMAETVLNFDEYVLVTFHRTETIVRRKRLQWVVEWMEKIAKNRNIVFVMHPATTAALGKMGYDRRLRENRAIQLMPLQTYAIFMAILAGAEYLVTDSGCVQEECAYLNIPCLLLRMHTERPDGLGENVVLSRMDDDIISDFILNAGKRERKPLDMDSFNPPSEVIAKELEKYVRVEP